MICTVGEVAGWVGGEVVGDPTAVIRAARPLSDAPKADEITVVLDDRYMSQFYASGAGAAVVDLAAAKNGRTLVRVKDPLAAFVAIVQRFHVKPAPAFRGVHPSAVIDPSATVAADASVGAFVSVGEESVIGPRCKLHNGARVGHHCVLGEDVVLGPNVVLYDGTLIGDRVTIMANSVIGADGFGYRTVQGRHVHVPQIGHVEIGDDVDIGACTTVDRATFGATRIGAGTKIDNLVMIAHNCQIGPNNLIVAQVGLAGSVSTGEYVVMAGQAGIADHVHIGDRSFLGGRSGIHKDVPPDQKMFGAPATVASEQMRIVLSLEKLPEMRKDLKAIKKRLDMTDS